MTYVIYMGSVPMCRINALDNIALLNTDPRIENKKKATTTYVITWYDRHNLKISLYLDKHAQGKDLCSNRSDPPIRKYKTNNCCKSAMQVLRYNYVLSIELVRVISIQQLDLACFLRQSLSYTKGIYWISPNSSTRGRNDSRIYLIAAETIF